jgi:AraC-like DNA-binding protein
MKGIIEQFLVGLVGKIKKAPHAIDQVSNLLAQQPGYASLDALADGCCLGPRQFQRTFTERMGVGPKLFARIARFDKAFRMKNNHPHLDWLTIALACGYHDYQHLVRDYLHFAAATPTAFYQEEAKLPNGILAGMSTERFCRQRRFFTTNSRPASFIFGPSTIANHQRSFLCNSLYAGATRRMPGLAASSVTRLSGQLPTGITSRATSRCRSYGRTYVFSAIRPAYVFGGS